MSDRVQSVVVDLNHQLLDTLDALRSLVGERIAVSASMAPGLGVIRVDPSAMRRAILGLAREADKAMPSGGGLLFETRNARLEDCSGAALPRGEYVCLSVSDTGTTPRSSDLSLPSDCRRALRLAPVYAFAKLNGGAATIRSESDKGTTVSLYLPRASKEASASFFKDETNELRVERQGIPNHPSARAARVSKMQKGI